MRIDNIFLRYLRNIVIIILIFYIGTILGYVLLGGGNLEDALTLKSIRQIKDIIYN